MEDKKDWVELFASKDDSKFRHAIRTAGNIGAKLFVGIDPGNNGAIAVKATIPNVGVKYRAFKMPVTIKKTRSNKNKSGFKTSTTTDPAAIFELLSQFPPDLTFFVLEKLNPLPSGFGGREKESPLTQFKLGRNMGEITMALIALNLPFTLVLPKVWQKGYRQSSGAEYSDRKKQLKKVAIKLFPNETVTLWNCDGLLLADYAGRISVLHKNQAKR